jgi:hypothetical protein
MELWGHDAVSLCSLSTLTGGYSFHALMMRIMVAAQNHYATLCDGHVKFIFYVNFMYILYFSN